MCVLHTSWKAAPRVGRGVTSHTFRPKWLPNDAISGYETPAYADPIAESTSKMRIFSVKTDVISL